MKPRAGGGYKMSLTKFTNGQSHAFGGTYTELTTGKAIQYTDRFDDPKLPGEMKVSITLSKVPCGTEVRLTQSEIPDAIPVEMCTLGWQQSLTLLAQLVEPEINEG